MPYSKTQSMRDAYENGLADAGIGFTYIDAARAWAAVYEAMQRFGMESDAIETLAEYFSHRRTDEYPPLADLARSAGAYGWHPGDDA